MGWICGSTCREPIAQEDFTTTKGHRMAGATALRRSVRRLLVRLFGLRQPGPPHALSAPVRSQRSELSSLSLSLFFFSLSLSLSPSLSLSRFLLFFNFGSSEPHKADASLNVSADTHVLPCNSEQWYELCTTRALTAMNRTVDIQRALSS